jgi:hypothetical protein
MKLALVVGSAACLWDDVKAARALATFDAVCCVKRVGIKWPEPFQVWATLHPEMMDDFEKRRAAEGLPTGYEIVAPLASEVGMHGAKGRIARRVSYKWPEMTSSAGSGIYGAKIMLNGGYKVVLAGIPMNDDPHFMKHETHGTGKWNAVGSFLPGFEKALPHLMGKVKSMSGLTREKLGAPDAEWLNA